MEQQQTDLPLSEDRAQRLPDRAFQFLRGVGLRPMIMEHLQTKGYNEEIHEQGWKLLLEISGYTTKQTVLFSRKHQDAVRQLDEWDEPNFRLTHACWRHRYPDQLRYVFHELSAEQGPKAILSVQTYLDRVTVLRKGTDPDRQATREQDKQAVALLETRGILTELIEAQLREWLADTQTTPQTDSPTPNEETKKQQIEKVMAELAVWYDEWSEIARVTIKRRDNLIFLGLASRRPPTPKDPK